MKISVFGFFFVSAFGVAVMDNSTAHHFRSLLRGPEIVRPLCQTIFESPHMTQLVDPSLTAHWRSLHDPNVVVPLSHSYLSTEPMPAAIVASMGVPAEPIIVDIQALSANSMPITLHLTSSLLGGAGSDDEMSATQLWGPNASGTGTCSQKQVYTTATLLQ